MEITGITFRRISPDGKMKAIVSVTFDDCFVVHDIKIIEGNESLFIAMPSRKMQNGQFKDIVHPISRDFRDKISTIILDAYERALEEWESPIEAFPEEPDQDNDFNNNEMMF